MIARHVVVITFTSKQELECRKSIKATPQMYFDEPVLFHIWNIGGDTIQYS